MKTLILHHSADLDGVLSGVIANYYINHRRNPLDIVAHAGADYGDDLDRDFDGLHISEYDEIYVLDFSDDWLFNAYPEKIIWIDHHKTAIEKGYKIKQYTEVGVAACRLALQFFTNINYPMYSVDTYKGRACNNEFLFVTLAGEYDIWDQRSKYSRLTNFGIRNLEWDYIDFLFRELKRIHTGPVETDSISIKQSELFTNIVSQGEGVLNYIQRTSSMIPYNQIKLFGHLGVVYNTHIKSSLIHELKGDEEFIMVWNYPGGPRVKTSFYSNDLDISRFATHFGGGGHKNAAGCQMPIHVLTSVLGNLYADAKL